MIELSAVWLLQNGPTPAKIKKYGVDLERAESSESRKLAVMKACWGYNSTVTEISQRAGIGENAVRGSIRALVVEGKLHSWRVGSKRLYSVVPEKYKEMRDDA